jgi:hypothetical protein
MNSLSELKELLISKEIEIKEFNGWSLKVGKDTWVMDHGLLYRNGVPQSLREKNIFDNYKRKAQNVEHQSTQTRKWRGISSRNYRGNNDGLDI